MLRNRGRSSVDLSDGMSSLLDLYLGDLSRYPLLSPDEEETIARLAQTGDQGALDTLVRSNLRFVISVAKRYQNRGLSFSDLIQEGNVGLITAAGKFDPDHGVKFISYAVWWIRQSILAALAKQGRVVRLPLNRATELARVVRVRAELRQKLDREPTDEEIGVVALLSTPTVEMLRRLTASEVRLDAPAGPSEDSSISERFLVDEHSVEEKVEASILRQHIAKALRHLRPRDARVVRLYYGLQGEDSHTLEEIGNLLGVTRERVRQLRDRALREIKEGEQGAALETFAA